MKLSDYTIKEAFGVTLSSIYRVKVKEILGELEPMETFLSVLDQPRFTDLDRFWAREVILPAEYKMHMKALKHMNRIKKMNIKNDSFDIEKAKQFPIRSLYDFKRRSLVVNCAFHDDFNPSAIINKDNTYKCFSCGFFGDSIAFYQKLHKCNFKQAVKEINNL